MGTCAVAIVLLLGPAAAGEGAVVISEIGYHPRAGDERQEFVEISNRTATPEDLSGWSFAEGIDFEFPPGTILPGSGVLAVCADATAVKARFGIDDAIGDFSGALDDDGERIALANHAGVVVSSASYRHRGKWPAAPGAGTGHTLVLRALDLDPGEPESWEASPEPGGSPGAPNFPPGGVRILDRPLVAAGAAWRLREGTGPFSAPAGAWRAPAFDDAGWTEAPSGFGYRIGGGEVVAYIVPEGTTGNQAYGGPLGMDFVVVEAIDVVRLGVFDSGSDGLALPITARLFDRDSRTEVASIPFTPADPGEPVGGSRFKDLDPPIELPAGFQGTIVAEGYGASEPNGNQGSGPMGLTTGDGGGAIAFIGGARYGTAAGSFPENIDGGPADRYAAGTFAFRRPGDPGAPEMPAGARTLLAGMPGSTTTIALRRQLDLTAADLAAPGDLLLGVAWSDGFAAWLNGTEISRSNLGAPGSEPDWSGISAGSRGDWAEVLFGVNRDLLVEGRNVLAVIASSSGTDDGGFVIAARLLIRQTEEPGGGPGVVFNELFRDASAGGGWVELYNAGREMEDLSGLAIIDRPGRPDPYRLPAGTRLEPGAFLVVGEGPSGLSLSTDVVDMFLVEPSGIVVAGAAFERGPAAGIPAGGFSECRHPDGGPLEWVTDAPTPNGPNRVDRVEGVRINEILYHPPEDREGEFIEIHNGGAGPVDVSGFRFDKGVQFTFPAGTWIPTGGYLVVSGSPEVILEDHGVVALGPWEGRLSDRGEALRLVDPLGNPVDRVRWHDGGRWPKWADGGGSSLEKIDPAQDGSFATAWEPSDESEKSEWADFSWEGAYAPGREPELRLHLAERGECRIDDVALSREGGPNLIPNPGFETSTSPWRIGGTHIESRRTADDGRSGAACLAVAATGKGDDTVNRIACDTSAAMTAGSYAVSLSARWLRGSSLLIVRGPYGPGPFPPAPCFTCGVAAPNLSGNGLGMAVRLPVPFALGTPGAENSATRRLRAATGGDNLGPVIDGVLHRPALPGPGESPILTARVADSDGVASVRARWRTGSAAGAFEEVPLADDGLHGDGGAGDGIWGGALPGLPAGTRAVTYVEATDAKGTSRSFPVEAPGRTLLYLVAAPTAVRLDPAAIVLDTQGTAELQSRQLHSNDLLEGTFVWRRERVFHGVGIRYRGSPWGRPSRAGYRVKLPEDDRLFGREGINLGPTGGSAAEAAAHFLISRSATPGRPVPVADVRFVAASLNGASLGGYSMLPSVDRVLLEEWFGEGQEGPLLKVMGRFVFNDGGGLIGQDGWEGGSLIDRGENPEMVRGYFVQSMERSRDDWSPFFDLLRILDPASTPNEVFDREAGTIIDLDGLFRALGTRILITDCDAFGINNGHNGYMAFDSVRGLWTTVPFDVECIFGNSGADVFGVVDPGMKRLLGRPATRRAYVRALSGILDGIWSPAATPFLDALARDVGLATAGEKGFIAGRRTTAAAAIRSHATAAFRIVTGGGQDFPTEAPSVVLEGEAAATVALLALVRDGGDPVPFDPAWTTPIRWKGAFDLAPGPNRIEVLGFDEDGAFAATASIVVTRAGAPAFVRGDANADGSVDLADGLAVLFGLFAGGPLPCRASADAGAGGTVGIDDAIAILGYLFQGGGAPPAPFPGCGFAETPGGLDCASFPPCR